MQQNKNIRSPEQVAGDAAPVAPIVNAAEQARRLVFNQAILGFVAQQVPLHKCILFLGSAIHAPAPKNSKYTYPSDKCPPIGNELAELLAKTSGFDGSDKTDLQRVAQHFEHTLDRQPLVQEIKKHVGIGKEPSPVLNALAAMRFPLVITTNYDNLYEQAINTVNARRAIAEAQAAGGPVDVPAIEAASRGRYDLCVYSRDKNKKTDDCSKQLDPERPYILKIHGDISDSKSIVITDEDYIHFVMRMSDKEPYHPIGPNVMTHLIENYILFIGYRLIDYNLRLLFKTLRWKRDAEDVFPAYAIDRDPDYLIREVWEKEGYRYGAISETESTPERWSAIDPSIVQATNDELAGEQNSGLLLERGRFMGQLLIPSELDRQLSDNAPLVILLDDNTSRIHWELVSPPNAGRPTARGKRNRNEASSFPYEDAFLGTSRGLTRQFTDMYSMLPEPPPPPRRTLRVLVVADPAEDARLPGAEIEGIEVANVFESFNSVYETGLGENRVEVIKLLGPVEATRTNVLRELMVHHYDVLYFSGHCVYRWDGDASRSGWIFNAGKKEILSANELNRIDRIPRFVFSNASEMGITPHRARERSGDLAPGFARMFFARGVSNFVCPAWPLEDVPARLFAQTLFAALLGLEPKEEGSGYKSASPKPMNIAMREARLRLAVNHGNPSDWGAFQHYGNPYFQFFAE